jgi:hypothetical protein
MCRNWQEGDEVVVNYPSRPSRAGTVVTRNNTRGTFCVLFFGEEGSTDAEEADPNVQESWMEAPGQHAELSLTGCDDEGATNE